MFRGRTVLLASSLARPRPATPPGAPTRPARGMSGFWIRQVIIITTRLIIMINSITNRVISIMSIIIIICIIITIVNMSIVIMIIIIIIISSRIQNPDMPLARRDGAHGGVAGRGRAGLDANRTVRPGNKPPSHPPKHRRHVASSPQKHEQAKSYVNRWGNKTRG